MHVPRSDEEPATITIPYAEYLELLKRAGRVETAVTAHGNTPSDVVWTVEVFREDDGRFAADYRTGDKREGGMGEYSATPIGALAELCATLIKIAEDKLADTAHQEKK